MPKYIKISIFRPFTFKVIINTVGLITPMSVTISYWWPFFLFFPPNFSAFSLSLSLSFFLGRYLWHMKVPMLGVEWELQLPAYTTFKPDSNHICDLYHSLWQHHILNPLREARYQTSFSWIPVGFLTH